MGKFKMTSIKDSIKDMETEETQAGKEAFRVGEGILSNVSKASAGLKITNLARDRIEKNPKNKYSISGIPALAESIKQYGLVQPLHVAPEKDGKYMLLGGERRLTAIDQLIEDPDTPEWTEETLIPCVVKGIEDVKLDLSPENKERYAIITTNRESRAYTDGDIYMELQEWKLIIEELRKKGIEYISHYDESGQEEQLTIKGEKTRDILSQATGMSRSQINQFELVHNRGSEGIKDALVEGKLSVGTAAKAARELTKEEQEGVAGLLQKGEKVTAADIAKHKMAEERETITGSRFRSDIKAILTGLKEREVILDGIQLEKYHYHIRQIEKLLISQD